MAKHVKDNGIPKTYESYVHLAPEALFDKFTEYSQSAAGAERAWMKVGLVAAFLSNSKSLHMLEQAAKGKNGGDMLYISTAAEILNAVRRAKNPLAGDGILSQNGKFGSQQSKAVRAAGVVLSAKT